MTIAITGATGQFGRLAIGSLLARGVRPADIVAIGGSADRLSSLAQHQPGLQTRPVDYLDQDAINAAVAGADRILLISGKVAGRRLPQHLAVVAAAVAAQPELIAYTSFPRADSTDVRLAADHVATERALQEAELPYVFLRNGWYLENYDLSSVLEHGLYGAAGDGRISATPRADLAEAAAVVLTQPARPGQSYELGGEAVTLTELAAEISRQSGRDVRYTDLTVQAFTDLLIQVGLDPSFAADLADADRGAAQGALYVDPHDLQDLLGRPATPIAKAVSAGLRALATNVS